MTAHVPWWGKKSGEGTRKGLRDVLNSDRKTNKQLFSKKKVAAS